MYSSIVLFVFQCMLYTPHLIGRTFYGCALGNIMDTVPMILSANYCATDRSGRIGSSSASNSGVPSFICVPECRL